MKRSKINKNVVIKEFEEWLDELPYLEKSKNTETAYRKAVENFLDFLQSYRNDTIDKLTLIEYKNRLLEEIEQNKLRRRAQGVGSIKTLNLRLTVINRIFNDLGFPDIKVNLEDDLTSNVETNVPTEEEFELMLKKAKELKKDRIALIIQTLAFTGMRISELKFLTRESLKDRYFKVKNKGKTRYVFIPKKLKNRLLRYCRDNKIVSGMIFHGRSPDRLLDQAYIRREMKIIAEEIDASLIPKAHPHAMRRLFARIYSQTPEVNPFWLSDILGHSIQGRGTTTALYTMGSERDYLNTVDKVEEYYYSQKKVKRQAQKKPVRRRKRRRNAK